MISNYNEDLFGEFYNGSNLALKGNYGSVYLLDIM